MPPKNNICCRQKCNLSFCNNYFFLIYVFLFNWNLKWFTYIKSFVTKRTLDSLFPFAVKKGKTETKTLRNFLLISCRTLLYEIESLDITFKEYLFIKEIRYLSLSLSFSLSLFLSFSLSLFLSLSLTELVGGNRPDTWVLSRGCART